MGGETSERQVSLMSGKNVWLKLLYSDNYLPTPYLLAEKGIVWELPYSFTFNYTTDEVIQQCENADKIIEDIRILAPPLRERLGLLPLNEDEYQQPRHMSLDQFCQEAAKEDAFVFNALHGGQGEDGRIQSKFDQYGLAYNGSGVEASKLCMDKYETGNAISKLGDPLLVSAHKKLVLVKKTNDAEKIWIEAINEFGTKDLVIKPRADGCSTGVVRLTSANELKQYLQAIRHTQTKLSLGTLKGQELCVELPKRPEYLVLEPFIITDKIFISGSMLLHEQVTDWIELTVGVMEDKGIYHSMAPSITVVQKGNVLSLTEKFQGGEGVNLTPPPTDIISEEQRELIRSKIELASKALGISGYARLDIFFNTGTNQTMIIEANTLPGLTPSTVIFHQALAEKEPLSPQPFLSKIITMGIRKRAIANLGDM